MGQYFLVAHDEGLGLPNTVSVILILIYLITYSFKPNYYLLSPERLIIVRLFKDVNLERNKIKSVELLDKDKLSWSIRTFGVGGLFGYFGKFANAKLGSMTWYATRKDRAVLVQTTSGEKIILTPNNPAQFVADFNA